jgi:hypothetical protein
VSLIDSGIRKALNSHGFAFQHAVLGELARLLSTGASAWTLEASEFPVSAGQKGTRVDFVLRQSRGQGLLVAECKRSLNTTWAFAKAPFVTKLSSSRQLTIDQVHAKYHHRLSTPTTRGHIDAYDICLPLKTSSLTAAQTEQECSCGTGGRSDPEEAFTQLLRGVNGVARFLGSPAALMDNEQVVPLLPVLFTSAELRVTDVDLKKAALGDGALSVEAFPPSRPVSWLWYQFPQSHEIRHELKGVRTPSDIATSLLFDHLRTVAVVTPAGIGDFLEIANRLL